VDSERKFESFTNENSSPWSLELLDDSTLQAYQLQDLEGPPRTKHQAVNQHEEQIHVTVKAR
jgi:hypothetical protein